MYIWWRFFSTVFSTTIVNLWLFIFYPWLWVDVHRETSSAKFVESLSFCKYKLQYWILKKIFFRPKILLFQVRKERPKFLPLKVIMNYLLNANFNWKKHYLLYKIEMLISMTIFNFFLNSENFHYNIVTRLCLQKIRKNDCNWKAQQFKTTSKLVF